MTDMVTENEFPKKSRESRGTDYGWSVEIRLDDYKEPMQFLGMLLTNKWKKFEIVPGPSPESGIVSIPMRCSFHGIRERYRLLEYSEAQALRWSLHAQFNALEGVGIGLNTRLVKHKIEYSSSCTPIDSYQEIGSEDRSDILPNWNMNEGDTFTFVNGQLVKNTPVPTTDNREKDTSDANQ